MLFFSFWLISVELHTILITHFQSKWKYDLVTRDCLHAGIGSFNDWTCFTCRYFTVIWLFFVSFLQHISRTHAHEALVCFHFWHTCQNKTMSNCLLLCSFVWNLSVPRAGEITETSMFSWILSIEDNNILYSTFITPLPHHHNKLFVFPPAALYPVRKESTCLFL